ncbi:MAG: transcriptional regulator [Tannerellaceae bacterium]|nr:transcriptional regulator [Tannerellaceae bacterium]
MEVGDKVLISPDLTMQKEWMPATVIEVENNSFIGIVVSAQTEDGNVFFGKEYLFKSQTERVCLL